MMDLITKTATASVDTFDGMLRGPGVFPAKVRLMAADGSVLSVLTGQHIYCTPRDQVGPYAEVEVAAWKRMPPEWDEYLDGCNEDYDADQLRVYGYVPAALVRAFLAGA